MPTQEEYNAYYNEQRRLVNTDRDTAIKRTNAHFGYGESSAAQFPVTDENLPPHVKPAKPKPTPRKK
jgi:hypothetical protein